MARHIDPHTLSHTEAESMLAAALHSSDVARLAAGIAQGRQRRRIAAIADRHGRNAIALADRLYGAPSADTAGMSDTDIIRELGL